MDIKTKMLLSLFKNNNYFVNLNDYLNEMVEENKLSYKDLKYLYDKMYKFRTLYVRQNIYVVSQFLIKGYTIEEAEKIAKLLPDAKKYTVFCDEDKDKGYIYNKLFYDLKFAYTFYDKYVKLYNSKEVAFEIIKEEIKKTNVDQRDIEIQIESGCYNRKEEIEYTYKKIISEMENLKETFEKTTIKDKNLIEYFKNTTSKDSFSSILVAGVILGKLDVERSQRNLEIGEYPYNEEQVEMVDKYYRMQETIDKIDKYIERAYLEEEEEVY